MLSTQELYGIDPKELKLLTYHEALQIKLEACEKRIWEVAKKLNGFYSNGNSDYVSISKINEDLKILNKAKKHLEKLIGELEWK